MVGGGVTVITESVWLSGHVDAYAKRSIIEYPAAYMTTITLCLGLLQPTKATQDGG